MTDQNDTRLQHEILNLAQYIKRFQTEIARLNKGDPDSNFKSMSDHLDAIIEHTDEATHTILQNLEGITDVVGRIQDSEEEADTGALCDSVMEKATSAMEACTFQDITGQRVTKIIRSMQFVEERVNSMIELIGRAGVEETASALPEEETLSEEEKLLNGPQLPGNAVSQDDIDKLFA